MNRIDKPSPIRGCCAGFSLIEIIVAVSIMTILVGMALPVLSTSVTRAKKKETREELNALKTSIEGYFQDVWAFPGSLNELVENISAVDGWVGPYITLPLSAASNDAPSISKDAWNQDYVITFSGNSSMEVSSLGPDASSGTSDDLSLVVDVTFIRRKDTLDELAIINTAIQQYNSLYLADNPLPADGAVLFSRLVTEGFLPAGDADLFIDGWGSSYVPDPVGIQPVVHVTSVNLGS